MQKEFEILLVKIDEAIFKRAARRAVFIAKNWDEQSRKAEPNEEEALENYEVITDLGELILDSEFGHKKKIDLYIHLYKICPSYSLMSLIHCFYWSELLETSKKQFWYHIIKILESEQHYLKEPITYSLWCDFFESPRTVLESWRALIHKNSNDEVLKAVLINSGPVPFYLKKETYYRLINSKYWHYYIFKSLLHSTFDVYGSIEPEEGIKILNRLTLPKETEYLSKLRKKLESSIN